jgi:hypothetical protein
MIYDPQSARARSSKLRAVEPRPDNALRSSASLFELKIGQVQVAVCQNVHGEDALPFVEVDLKKLRG